jgi:hypothetical protein
MASDQPCYQKRTLANDNPYKSCETLKARTFSGQCLAAHLPICNVCLGTQVHSIGPARDHGCKVERRHQGMRIHRKR